MINDKITLRKLTLKSKMDGINNNYQGWTIEQMFKYKPYDLLKTYYYFEKITFTDDVINLLKEKFDKFIEIEKPGYDKYIYDNVLTNEKTYQELKKLITYLRIIKKEIPTWLIELYYIKKNEDSIINKPLKTLSKIELRTKNQKPKIK
jgi:hypothetical protein